MKKHLSILLAALMLLNLAACAKEQSEESSAVLDETYPDAYTLSINADGSFDKGIPEGKEDPFVIDNNIVYYEEGHDFTYGEGTEADEHSADEAAAHTVVHITKPGTYVLKGTLSPGQIAVDLGEDAEEDPNAVVTLVLYGLDVTCTVAPAVIFYNVYECGTTDEANAVVDTSAAGANVIIADGSDNNIDGSYVARIYKSVELNDEGTEVVDSKKLHKYDAAFYSKKTMNIGGEEEGTGILNIKAENEGLDSELHLTINGGNINIESGNDGINTNEDGISVTTVNGGNLNIICNGSTGEGDGIDSNGWLVINGGHVTAQACAVSGDAGIDSDMGIHINGGTVLATGNMLDRISDSKSNYAVFQFAGSIQGGTAISLKDADGAEVAAFCPTNAFSYFIAASPELTAGDYTLWAGDTQLTHGGMGGDFGMGGMRTEDMTPPEGFDGERPEMPEGMETPEGITPPNGWEDFDPSDMIPPEGVEGMTPPDGWQGGRDGFGSQGTATGEQSITFTISDGGNMFSGVSAAAAE